MERFGTKLSYVDGWSILWRQDQKFFSARVQIRRFVTKVIASSSDAQ